jgi:hypothetical protein
MHSLALAVARSTPDAAINVSHSHLKQARTFIQILSLNESTPLPLPHYSMERNPATATPRILRLTETYFVDSKRALAENY